MSFFSDDSLRLLADSAATIWARSNALAEAYSSLTYISPVGREYALHGYSRRVSTLARCISQVFRLVPPDQQALPADDDLIDATINIQAFVFNVFGALDNLAWIWVSEKAITKPDGAKLDPKEIGIGKNYKFVRRSFSQAMQQYLIGLEPWFKHILDFRHALAHRVPLYIPPYCVPNAQTAAYVSLDGRKWAAVAAPAEYERIKAEQLNLVVFRPVMTHTLYDKNPPVVFHFQLLQDFATVEEIGQKMLEELARLPP